MHLYERPDHDFLWDGRLWQKRPIQADHTCATALAVHRASDDAHAARLSGGCVFAGVRAAVSHLGRTVITS